MLLSKFIFEVFSKFQKIYRSYQPYSRECFKNCKNSLRPRLLWNSFLHMQVLTCSLQYSYCKQVFGKLLGRPARVLKIDFSMDVLTGISRDFRSSYFFSKKFSQPFTEHRRTPLDGYIRHCREMSNCSKVFFNNDAK